MFWSLEEVDGVRKSVFSILFEKHAWSANAMGEPRPSGMTRGSNSDLINECRRHRAGAALRQMRSTPVCWLRTVAERRGDFLPVERLQASSRWISKDS